MPLSERRVRHEKLLGTLRRHDIHAWQEKFLDALNEAHSLEPARAGLDLADFGFDHHPDLPPD
jgi:trehalose-6-phosphate synthase